MGQVLVLGLIAGGIYALFALGVVLVYRGTGVLTFAQGEIGTVASVRRRARGRPHGGMPWWLGALAALAFAGRDRRAASSSSFVRRMMSADPVTTAVATVGLTLFLLSGEFMLFGESPREAARPRSARHRAVRRAWSAPHQVLALLVAVALGFGLQAVLRRTDFGLGILAAAQDPAAARLVGVPLSRVTLTVWGAGGALSGLAALLVEPTVGIITPGYASEFFVFGLAAAVIGGLTACPVRSSAACSLGHRARRPSTRYFSAGPPGTRLHRLAGPGPGRAAGPGLRAQA